MKKVSLLLLIICSNYHINAQWSSNGDTNRGTQLYTSQGALGYSIRTNAGGGWAWQLVDGSNNSYFHVSYPTASVGIGTTSPNAKLHIISQASGTAGLLIQGQNGDNWFPYTDGKNYLRGTTVLADVGGSVGIGTATPSKTLEVAGDAASNSLYLSTAWNNARINGNGEYIEYRSSWYHTFYGVTNSNPAMFIDGRTSKVGVNTSSPDASLTVNGQVHAKEVKVDLNIQGPDYVFEKDYKLSSLEEIKNYIDQNKHLPEVPSAKEMEKNGVQLGEMNMLLLKKIEELTLLMIKMKKENDDQVEQLHEEIKKLKK
jgi:hypothetical protein